MAIVHSKSLRKTTGGMRRAHRKKKKFEIGRPWVPTIVGELRKRLIRTKGGGQKQRLLKADYANVSNGKKVIKTKISQVVENSSNPFFVRRNIITKGSIIETAKGYARVTSRPGQDGIVNAVLLKDYKPAKLRKKR
ncbi:MAG: 30S ribosomal protein S8e [Candidatus Altiarchaeota archaeon]|nr:30S ribosomal protein S8e [Candidatus Altiarchaeota archaeon]